MFRAIRNCCPIWLYLPWWNLGCLGLRLGPGALGWLYCDLQVWPRFGSLYCRIGARRYCAYVGRPWAWHHIR